MINTNFKYLPYIVRDLVSLVREEYDTADPKVKPVYEFGTYLELTKRMVIKDKNDNVKYPLIWLVWEANESIQTWSSKVMYSVSPRLFFVNVDLSKGNNSSVARYDANFIGVLYPLLELFQSQLEYSQFVTPKSDEDFRLSEHLYWGQTMEYEKKKGVLSDFTDAIEIKFNNLEINKIC